ncbi:hypothetical protein Ari01nite_25990 [Paractinoplanes rishiriensis]|uniref:HEAT repeat domain-containing protein n=1 Tax=Paractinoplanes rishiriensis TaxID=1050105 RepID=A0A919JXN3_9ACTN|nr:hypothetical protein Ari01nite_25990 [Actinoplanes rishiriensis]
MACAARGVREVVAACVELIEGGEADPALLLVLGGPDAPQYLHAPDDQRYWLRVWGTRGLGWALGVTGAPAADEPAIVGAILTSLGDGWWRVREQGLKIIARYGVDDAQPVVVELLSDEVPRVRVAAARALRVLSTGSRRERGPGPDRAPG